jgi:hypothetical protein
MLPDGELALNSSGHSVSCRTRDSVSLMASSMAVVRGDIVRWGLASRQPPVAGAPSSHLARIAESGTPSSGTGLGV